MQMIKWGFVWRHISLPSSVGSLLLQGVASTGHSSKRRVSFQTIRVHLAF